MQEQEQQTNIKLKVRTGLSGGAGLGDVIANFTQATGLDKLADVYTDVTGKDCGCNARKKTLNDMFPNII